MRRMFVFLLIFTLQPLACLCETGAERLQTLDILSQRDERLSGEKYFYQNMLFRIGGCLPASITNALTALVGTPETDGPALALEVMRGLSEDPSNRALKVDISMLDYRLHNPFKSAVQMQALLDRVTNVVTIPSRGLTPADVLIQYAPTSEDHPLIMRSLKVEDCWTWVLDMSAELCRQGHPDARFALCAASAGTEESGAPLSSGNSGHYITLYFVAGEFHEEGTFYLLDSLPRALPGDVYGFMEHYPSRYPFTTRRNSFGSIYNATRITDPVLMFTLTEEAQAYLAAADEADRTDIRRQQMETLTLYLRSHFMLYIP